MAERRERLLADLKALLGQEPQQHLFRALRAQAERDRLDTLIQSLLNYFEAEED